MADRPDRLSRTLNTSIDHSAFPTCEPRAHGAPVLASTIGASTSNSEQIVGVSNGAYKPKPAYCRIIWGSLVTLSGH